MSILSSIQSGVQQLPPRIVIYGTEKVGKSTFAASAPAPIFIQTEDGLAQIKCDKFPKAKSFDDVVTQLQALRVEKHDYGTVVIDSLDWLERLVWAKVVADAREISSRVDNIEKVGGGYGKGYTLALTQWGEIVRLLDSLRDELGMCAICIAHAKVEKFSDPEQTSNYDRYSPRLQKLAAGLFCEWADAVLFATHKIIVSTKDAGSNKEKATARSVESGGSDRVMRCVGGPAFVAGNRYRLPPELPLSWDAFVTKMSG